MNFARWGIALLMMLPAKLDGVKKLMPVPTGALMKPLFVKLPKKNEA